MWDKYLEQEKRLALFIKRWGIVSLRLSMGLIYLWFGLLKFFDLSPAEEMVLRATHWMGIHNFENILGVWEALIGLCLLIRKFNRVGLILLFLQFPGTFLPLFLNPEDSFTVIPFGLTLEGQYVMKNLVFFTAALVLFSSLHEERHP